MRGKGWRQAPFPGPLDLLLALDPSYIETPALRLISDRLVQAVIASETEDNPDYLAISLAPQEGKSSTVARAFPLWLWLRNPDLRIMIISYDNETSVRWGRDIKNALRSHAGDEALFGLDLHLSLKPGSEAVNRLQLDGHRGSISCMSLTGGIAGRPADCLVGDTEITTTTGCLTIRDVYRAHLSGRPQQVLSWNADTGATEFRPVVAVRRIPDRSVVEIVTTSGRTVRCTPEHRVHTPDGFREAALLKPGDVVTVRWEEYEKGMPGVRLGPQRQGAHLPGLLQQDPSRSLGRSELRSVRQQVPEASRGTREAGAARQDSSVLHPEVPRGFDAIPGVPMPALREADGIEGPRAEVLLGRMPRGEQEAPEAAGSRLSDVRHGIPSEVSPHAVLHPELRGRRSLDPDDREGELALQGRHQLRRVVPAHATADPGAGRRPVPSVRASERRVILGHPQGQAVYSNQHRGPSHQREALGEPARELDCPLPALPHEAPQVEDDTVSVVRHLRGERHAVYDIQVAGNRNFFAGDVLVHNCIILDDVVKDRQTARSQAFKRMWRDQWQSNISVRLGPKALVVMDHTRWAEDDPIGQQLAENGARWQYLNIPAVVEHRARQSDDGNEKSVRIPDPLGRAEGEWLISARGRTVEPWQQKRTDVGGSDFWPLYQGQPYPAAGGLFKAMGFNRRWRETSRRWVYEIPGRPGPDEDIAIASRFITVDLAASTKSSADYTVAAAWAIAGTGELLMLDLKRAQVDPSQHWDEVVAPLQQVWQCPIYMEKSQFSTDLVYTAAREGAIVHDLDPDDNKYTRAVPAARRMDQGQVLFPPAAHWFPDFRDEVLAFPTGQHDDQVDVLAYAHRVRGAIWVPPQSSTPPPGRGDPGMAAAFGEGGVDIGTAAL